MPQNKKNGCGSVVNHIQYFSNAAFCWVKGVESDSFAHISIMTALILKFQVPIFAGAFAYGGGGSYGVVCCQ
jgi:hypothetical protein